MEESKTPEDNLNGTTKRIKLQKIRDQESSRKMSEKSPNQTLPTRSNQKKLN